MQKLVNGTDLYVFDLTPFEITQQTEAKVIYVQNERIKGYKELNASLADKIKGFNQFTITVLDKPWKDGVEPTPVTGHTLTLGGGDIHSHIEVYLDGVQQEAAASYSDIEANTAIKIVPTENVENYTLISGAEWDSEQNAWVATMPDADLEIVINYSEPATGHNFILYPGIQRYKVAVYKNGQWTPSADAYNYVENVEIPYIGTYTGWQYVYENVEAGTSLELVPSEPIANYNWDSTTYPADGNGHVFLTMPNEDFEIGFVCTSTGYTLHINGDGNVQANTLNVYIDGVQETFSNDYYNIANGTPIKLVPVDSENRYTVTISGEPMTWDTDGWVTTMPDEPLDIYVFYPGATVLFSSNDYETFKYKVNDGNWTGGGREDYLNTGDTIYVAPAEGLSETDFNVSDNLTWDSTENYWTLSIDNYTEYNVTVNYTNQTYSTTFTADSTPNIQDVVQIDPSLCHENDEVYIRFLHGNSSSNITVTSTDVTLNYDQANDEYYFTMPAQNVEIKAVASSINVDVDLTTTDLTFDSSYPYDPQETYYPGAYFKVKCPSGKNASKYTFNISGAEITVTPDQPQTSSSKKFEVHFYGPQGGTVTFSDYTPL